MSEENDYIYGIVFEESNEIDKKIRDINDETISLENINKEKLITKISEFDMVYFHIYIIGEPVKSKDLTLLKDFLTYEKLINNFHKININIAYEDNNKKMALKLYCYLNKFYDEQCNNKYNLDLTYLNDMISDRVKRKEEVLNFVKMYYDMDAITLQIRRGPLGYTPTDLKDNVNKRAYIPEKFWYWHEYSSIYWQKLIAEDSNYDVTKGTTSLLTKNTHDIINKSLKKHTNEDKLSFIDLGVGTPKKDIIIIEEITRYCLGCELTYYPVDISFPLIEYTLRKIFLLKKDLQEEQCDLILDIIPILGDFEKLHESDYQVLLADNKPKLIALLGNTMGNLIETDILRTIKNTLNDNGYFLVDVEFTNSIEKDDDLIKQYQTKEMYDFVFHPLELLDNIHGNPFHKGTFTNNMDVKIIDSKEEGVIEWNFYNRTYIKEVTNVENSKIVSMFYKISENSKILMAWSTKYDQKSFENFMESNGLEIIQVYIDNNKRYGLYLFKIK